MKVQDAMTKDAVFCAPHDNLADAVRLMLRRDCGVLAVVDDEKKVIGIFTDRDISIAAATRDAHLAELKAEIFIRKKIVLCAPDEKIEQALRKMKKNRVKRLPVAGQDRVLVGMISIADVLSAAGKNKSLKKKIVSALKSISKPNPILLREIS